MRAQAAPPGRTCAPTWSANSSVASGSTFELVSAYLGQTCDQVACARAAGESLATPRMQVRLDALKLAASELNVPGRSTAWSSFAGLAVGYSRSAPIPLERHFPRTCGRPG